MERTVFRYSWKRTLAYLAGGVVLACLCILAGRGADDPRHTLRWLTWLSLVFSATMAWLLLRPRVLELNGRGFILSGGFTLTATEVPWGAVSEFYVYRTGRGTKAIGYRLKGPPRNHTHLADIPGDAPREANLPWGWDEPLEEIVSELERYRRAAEGCSSR